MIGRGCGIFRPEGIERPTIGEIRLHPSRGRVQLVAVYETSVRYLAMDGGLETVCTLATWTGWPFWEGAVDLSHLPEDDGRSMDRRSRE